MNSAGNFKVSNKVKGLIYLRLASYMWQLHIWTDQFIWRSSLYSTYHYLMIFLPK